VYLVQQPAPATDKLPTAAAVIVVEEELTGSWSQSSTASGSCESATRAASARTSKSPTPTYAMSSSGGSAFGSSSAERPADRAPATPSRMRVVTPWPRDSGPIVRPREGYDLAPSSRADHVPMVITLTY
jgi:hypothetical protein